MISSFSKTGIAFILGITLSFVKFWLFFSISALFILMTLILLKKRGEFWSWILLIFAFFTGFSYSSLHNRKLDEAQKIHKRHYKSSVHEVISVKTGKAYTHLVTAMELQKSSSAIRIQLSCKSGSMSFRPGDLLEIEDLNIKRVNKSKFPWRFDFNTLLFQKGIYFSAWVQKEQIEYVGHRRSFKSTLAKIRSSVHDKLAKITNNSGEIMAICLGDKTELDPSSKNLFIESGVAHIMAVSGLHIGIVYLIILSMLKLLRLEKKISGILSSIFLVWLFILLTGAPVSAIRAGLMISIYSIFLMLGRKNEKLHLLLFTALIILLINPRELLNIGFQLSFLALIGILYFAEYFTERMHSKNTILNYFSGIIAVSLAVQITTLPISLYYFHAFPLHFLLTNLIAIPFAFLVLILFLIAMLFWMIPVVNELVLSSLDQLIHWTKGLFTFFHQFEFLFLKGLYLFESTLIVYYAGLLVFFGVWKTNHSIKQRSMVLLGICFIVQTFHFHKENSTTEFFVYDDKGICFLVKNGNESLLMCENEKVKTHFFHPFISNHLDVINLKGEEIIRWENLIWALNPSTKILEKYQLDYIVYSDLKKAEENPIPENSKVLVLPKVNRYSKRSEFIEIKDFIQL